MILRDERRGVDGDQREENYYLKDFYLFDFNGRPLILPEKDKERGC